MERQRRLAVIVIVAVVLAGIGGGIAARAIKSPDQVAAETAPPKASLITVPVERRKLSADLIVRGTARHSSPAAVTLSSSDLKSSAGTFTTLPAPGASIADGSAALAVSGRPVFAFSGALPAYRDMTLGSSGPDVQQLQDALARAGINPGRTDGVYDGGTAAAVATFYERAGFAPFGPTESQRRDLQAARDAAFSAQDRLLQAQLAVESARTAAASDVQTLQASLSDAQSKLNAALQTLNAAQQAVGVARAEETRDNAAAAADVQSKTNARDAAAANLEDAKQKRDNPPPGATQEDLDALQAAVDQAEAELAAAQADLAAAQTNADAVRVSGAANVANALNAVDAANTDVALASADVQRLQAALDAAQSGGSGTEASLLESIADVAAKQAAAANADYAELARRIGVQVPADEVLFFPSLPLRVDEVTAKPGELVKDSFMTLSGLQLVIDSSVTPTDARLVTKGAKVLIEETDLKISATGAVTAIADHAGTNGVDPSRIYLEITPVDPPAQLLGASVKLSIAVTSTAGEVLAVPASALSIGADGTTRVQIERPDRTTVYVEVIPGLAAQGLVEVSAPKGGLNAGDNVVVGFNQPGASALTTTTLSTTPTTDSTASSGVTSSSSQSTSSSGNTSSSGSTFSGN